MKIIKGLGMITFAITPILSVIACGGNDNSQTGSFEEPKEVPIEQANDDEPNSPKDKSREEEKKEENSTVVSKVSSIDANDDIVDKKNSTVNLTPLEPQISLPLTKINKTLNKSKEEIELDEFEAKWKYRPKKPLEAYPDLDFSLALRLRYLPYKFINSLFGYEEHNYTYWLEDNKQDLYLSNDDKAVYKNVPWKGNAKFGNIIIRISEENPDNDYKDIFAIYYELFDLSHEKELIELSNIWTGRWLLQNSEINWDYKDSYSSYENVLDEDTKSIIIGKKIKPDILKLYKKTT